MVGIVTAVGREIEGDREALLPGGEVTPVEGVGVFRRGEAGILPDRPGLGDVHRGVGTAQIGRDAGIGVEKVEPGDVVRPVDRFHRDALRREPRFRGGGNRCRNRRGREFHLGEIRNSAHSGRPLALMTENITLGSA
jgi:hypothetical protein